jgi:hypothetical protein
MIRVNRVSLRLSFLVLLGRGRQGRASLECALWLVTAALLAGAGDPTIIPVRLPAKDVSKYFPAGTELRVMPVEKFESLVAGATEGLARRRASEPTRLIRAHHRARLRSGVLEGRSEIVVAAARTGPADFLLKPWTPAVLARSQTRKLIGARASGETSLWIDQSPNQANVIEWDLQPRSHLGAKSFTLGLPGNDTTVLTLEVPKDWAPWCRHGRRSGPLAGAAGALENVWEIEAEAGQIDVRLYEPIPGASLVETSTWISGSTQIDLRRSADRAGSLVNWRAELRLELDPRNPRPLEIDLDPGLELIDVQGPSVRGYHSERVGAVDRLKVMVDAGTKASAEIVLLAHAQVPSEGEWSVPGLRPLNATWTGGMTSLLLDELHILKECREKAGRRVYPAGPASGPADRLEFESGSPRSVAELVFRRPRSDTPCEVRGRLFVAGPRAKIECELTWAVHDASMSKLEIDVSPTWLTDQVMIRGKDDPLVWHPSLLPSGNTRLHVALPAGAITPGELIVTVRASSTVAGGRGPLQLPRVRPVKTPVLDEAWVAWVDQGTMVQPTLARGLAWIDPDQVPRLLAPGATTSPELREALAWRWIAEVGAARVDRQPIDQDPGASIRVHARIDPHGQRLIVDGRLQVYASARPLDSIPLWIGTADGLLGSWRFSDFVDGTLLATRPIDQPARSRLGLPSGGMALFLVVKIPSQTEKTIRFHAEYSWNNRGLVPLLSPSRGYRSRGTVLIDTPPKMQVRVQTVGVRRLAASALEEAHAQPGGDLAAGSRDGREPAKIGLVDAFAYTEAGGRLEVTTEPLAANEMPGIVREAFLTTLVDPKGTLLNRLRLLVNAVDVRALDFTIPSGLTLVRVRRDGADVTPIATPAGLSISLTGSGPASRSSTIVFDYLSQRGMIADGDCVRPELPRVALPCISFVWEIVTPPTWRATDPGSGLIAIDRRKAFAWPYNALALPTPAWNSLGGRASPHDEDVLRLLGDRLTDSVSADLTFAEWFSRCDSGPRPVVIDRVALSAAGLGPKSQFVPTIAKNGSRSAALATLERHGLALAPLQSVFLITTERELTGLESRDRWSDELAEALAWGSDRSDRFQTLGRWRGEPSPKLTSASGAESAPGQKPPPGWSTWSFEGPTWPDQSASIYLIDMRARIVAGWMVAAICLLVWMRFRAWFGRWRLFFLASILVVCLLTERLLPARSASTSAGVYLGAFALLLIELGRGFWRPSVSSRAIRRPESSLVRRGAGTAVCVALIGISVGKVIAIEAAMQADKGSAILALFPYEGPFDPKRPAPDVILRLADFNRLSRMAESDDASPASVVRAVGALHRVTRQSGVDVVVESEIELTASGRAPFAWEFPVSFAHDIQVFLDGKRLPIAIEPGGARGRVSFAQAGEHRLRIRRSAATSNEESISIPVNAIPLSKVVVDPRPDGRQDAELIARGGTELQPDHSLIGRLGPAEKVEVHWQKLPLAAIAQSKGSLEGLILWDITPAGDRVRARLTCHQSANLSTIRFAHQDGLILRSARVAGSADTFCEENAGKREWALHVDPPLRDGSTIELDCWLPTDQAPGRQIGSSASALAVAGGLIRDFPHLEPIGIEKYSGSLGVRRPGDWTGRFDPLPDTDPISDESFVESWGSLPQELLTLCGTSRFVRESRASLLTGPPPTRYQVKPTFHVQIESGRVAITLEAELSELAGHLRHVQAEVPENIQIIEVTGDGLSDWTVSALHRLHLMFDRPFTLPKRKLRIVALITLKEEPLQISTRQHQVKTPWIWWEGAEASAGFLTISSIAKPELRESTGLTLISAETSRAGVTNAPRYRSTYRVDDSRKLGEILWESIPARVSVAIESQMTIHPDRAEWVAVLRYDVIGGALDAIRLRMPAAWAGQAELSLAGSEYQLTRETSGLFSFWSITPERPIWGSQRFVLRATRALDAGRDIEYPEISPLGQGAVDAYLVVVDATDRSLAIESTVGLQPIAYSTRFHAGEFATGAGKAVNAFRVSQKTWTLRVQSPRSAFQAGNSPQESVRLALADLAAVVLPDRSLLGSAVYETVPGTGAGMSFELPSGAALLWATVDFNVVVPLRTSSGMWSIVCDNRRPCRIGLIWRTGNSVSHTMGSRSSLPLPRAGIGSTMTLLSVYAPTDLRPIQGELEGLQPAGMARLEMTRAEWLVRSVNDHIGKFDRSSGRDHEKLVSLLINHEMALRGAQRSVQWTDPGNTDAKNGSAEHDVELIRSARAARDEMVGRAGLENDLTSARIYLGESLASVSHPLGGVPETSAPERIRFLGRPFTFIGLVAGIDGTSSSLALTLESQPLAPTENGPSDSSTISILLLVSLWLATLSPGRITGQGTLAVLAALGLAGYTGGPFALVAAMALMTAARKLARS